MQQTRRTVSTGKRRPVRHIGRRRWADELPLRDGPGAMRVNWIGFDITNADTGKKGFRTAFGPDLAVDRRVAANAIAGLHV